MEKDTVNTTSVSDVPAKAEEIGQSQNQESHKNLPEIPIHSELKDRQRLCFDAVNQKLIATNFEPPADPVLLLQYDQNGTLISKEDVSDIVCPTNFDDTLSSTESQNFCQVESKLQNPPSPWSFEDNMSILRFKSANQGNTISISNCGFEVTVIKQSQKKKDPATTNKKATTNEFQLVLTNMTFSSGVHYWEIICPISCQDIYVGAFNPLSQKEVMETFYNTTPRSIFVCLDLNLGQIKFWLNEHKMVHKILQLHHQPGQQWIPSIKIGRVRNRAILNPFPYVPQDFFEDCTERNFDFSKLLIPHLFNTICVTGLPKVSTESKQAVDQLKNLLHLSNNQLNKITLFKTQGNKPLPDNEMLCFLKFHNYEMMIDFIDYHRSNQTKNISGYKSSGYRSSTKQQEASPEKKKSDDSPPTNRKKVEFEEENITILEPQEIISLLLILDEKDEASVEKTNNLKVPLKLIKKEMNLCEANGLQETKQAICKAYKTLTSLQPTRCEQQTDLKIIEHSFADKIICLKDYYYLKLVHREAASGHFNLSSGTSFSEPPRTLESMVTLHLKVKFVASFFKFMNWQSMFKQNKNRYYLGFIKRVFEDMSKKCKLVQDSVQFQVKLLDMKYFIESAKQHVQIALKKQVYDLQTTQVRHRMADHHFERFEFQPESIPDLDQIYIVYDILIDLEEQLWIQTRSNQSPSDVKNFMNSVSRPQSAFCRLGSFTSLPIQGGSPLELAEMGYIYKQNQQFNHFMSGNSRAQISQISYRYLKDPTNLEKYFGRDNRMLNGFMVGNVDLHRSLNYQLPNVSGQQILDIIPSINSQFTLVSKPNGVVQLHTSLINLSDVKQIIMFSNDGDRTHNLHCSNLKKLKQKEQDCIKCNTSILAKSSEIKFLCSIHPIKKKVEDKKPVIKKKKAKKAAEPDLHVHTSKKTYKEDMVDMVMEADELEEKVPEEPQAQAMPKPIMASKESQYQKFDVSQCEIYGYFFLTEPAHKKALDPVVLGCVFKNEGKIYIRVKKLMYKINYLKQFIELDPDTGYYVNKYSQSQMTLGDPQKNQNILEILNEVLGQHQQQIVDMNAIFLRNLDKKAPSKNKLDSRFQIFQEICEADILVDNAEQVIDFTRCSYSINNQNVVHLITKVGEQTMLRQFQILEEDYDLRPFENAPRKICIEPIRSKNVENAQKVFQFEYKVVVVGEKQAQIFDQNDFYKFEVKNIGDAKIDSLSMANKTPKHKLYSKDNMVFHQQNWSLVFRLSSGAISQLDLVPQQTDNTEVAMSRTFSADELNSMIRDFRAQPLVCECKTNAQVHHQRASQEAHSFTVLENDPIKIDIFPQDGQFKAVSLNLTYNLKCKHLDQVPALPSTPLSGQSRPLPLMLEQWKGAQVNDSLQPSFIVNKGQTVFCSNYPQPEYIFKHQHDQKFVMTSFTIKSLFNRDGQGMPIGKGYIFASDCLEDISSTKKYLLAMGAKKWVPAQYMPNEPIGCFDLDEHEKETIQLLEQYQRAYRFVKLVPTGFRKGPINFSRVKFHSKQAEIKFFGINGFEVEEEKKEEVKNGQQIACLQVQGQELRSTDQSHISKMQVSGTRASQQFSKNPQYTPLYSLDENISIPFNLSGPLSLTFSPPPGLEISSFKLQVLGQKMYFLKEYNAILQEHDKFYNGSFKFIFDNAETDNIGWLHFKMLKELFKYWRSNNPENLEKFISQKLEEEYLRQTMEKVFSKLHKIEIEEFVQMLKQLIKNENEMIFEFVKNKIKISVNEKMPKMMITSLLSLARVYMPATKIQDLQNLLISTVQNEICQNKLTIDKELYQAQRDLKEIYDFHKNIIEDGFVNIQGMKKADPGKLVKKYLSNIALDGKVGESLLITDSLTELYKVNNLYHFNICFAQGYRLNKIKFCFDEKSKKQSSFKMRVNIIVPGSGLIFSQCFDENQIYHVNQLAFKKSSLVYFRDSDLHRLTLDLSDSSGGPVTRYLTIQVQLIETMKSTKESPVMVNNCLMFPLVFGYKSQDLIKKIPELEIKRGKNYTKKTIGLETNHVFKIYEIEGLSPKKYAMFALNEGELTEEIPFESLQQKLDESRKIILEQIQTEGDRRKIFKEANNIMEMKLNYRINFKVLKNVSFAYFLKLSDLYCEEIIHNFKQMQQKDENFKIDQVCVKKLIQKLQSTFHIENQKKLPKFIHSLFVYLLKNIDNQVEFLCEIMDQFIMSKSNLDLQTDKESLNTILLLIKEVQISLDQIIEHYISHFECQSSENLTIEQVLSQFSNIKRNNKQSLGQFKKLLIFISFVLKSQISSKKRKKILEIDIGLYLRLVADHIVHCPKIKFEGELEFQIDQKSKGQYKKSIESTKFVVNTSIQTLIQIVEYNFKHGLKKKSKIDSKNDLVTLIAAQNFTNDKVCQKVANQFFMMYSKFNPKVNVPKILETIIKFEQCNPVNLLFLNLEIINDQQEIIDQNQIASVSTQTSDIVSQILNTNITDWLKIFQIILRLIKLNSGFDQLEIFHQRFFSLSDSGTQHSLYPHFLTQLKLNLSNGLLLSVLQSILTQDFSDVQYSYASSILSLLQHEQLHIAEIPAKKIEEYQVKNVDQSFIQKIKDDRKMIKNVMTKEEVLQLTQIFTKYLNKHLNIGNFGGVAGANFPIICKLTLANQMVSIIDLAAEPCEGKLSPSCFQNFFFDKEISEKAKKTIISDILDWLLMQKQTYRQKDQPSVAKATFLKNSLLSILYQCSAPSEIYEMKQDIEPGLNVALGCLINKIIEVDQKLLKISEKDEISQFRALQLQENSNTIMIQLFQNWVITEKTAQSFLKDHNGFNFIIDRLFKDQGEEIEPEFLDFKGFSSDESDSSLERPSLNMINKGLSKHMDNQAHMPVLRKQTGVNQKFNVVKQPDVFWGSFPGLVFNEATPQAPEPNLEKGLKEQELGNQMWIIYSSDQLNMAEKMFKSKNLSDSKNGVGNNCKLFQVSFKEKPSFEQEYYIVVESSTHACLQISEIVMGIFFKSSIYDKDISYLPLIVTAEGGMGHQNGQILDSSWTVQLSPVQDQGMSICDLQAYGHEFSSNKEAKFIKITLRHPMTSLLEASFFYQQLSKPMNYTVQFISCIGAPKVEASITQLLEESQKESSLQMLSQFFQNQFQNTFLSISQEPEVINKIKVVFSRITVLLESKQDLIKPIFVSLCQDNDELCNWVIKEQLLLDDFSKVNETQIQLLGDLVKTQKKKQSFLSKILIIKEYLFEQIQLNVVGLRKITQKEELTNLFKLANIYTKCMKNFHFKEGFLVEITDTEILDILKFKNKLLKNFKDDAQKVRRSIFKLLVTCIQPPAPFKNQKIDINYVSNLIIQNQLSTLKEFALNNDGKICVDWIQDLDILTCFASHSVEIFQLLSSNKHLDAIEKDFDIVQEIITQLFQKSTDSSFNSDSDVVFDDPKPVDEDQKLLTKNAKYSTLLLNLSQCKIFREKYSKTLPFQIYNQVIKSQSEHAYKLMLNQYLDEKTIMTLLTLIQKLTLEKSSDLEKLSKMLKEDLNEASKLEDIGFIQKVIVPLLHSEKKMLIRLNVENKEFKSQAKESNSIVGKSYFINSDIMTDKMKATLEQKFVEIRKEKMFEVNQMVKSEWKMIYSQKKPATAGDIHPLNYYWPLQGFKDLCAACEGRSQIMIIIKGNQGFNNSGDYVIGGYCHSTFPNDISVNWQHEFDYHIAHNENNFGFIYSETSMNHFEVKFEKPFGYIYTDHEYGGALNILGDFAMISWSQDFTHSFGNVPDLKCLDETNEWAPGGNLALNPYEIQIWQYQPGVKLKQQNLDLKKQFKQKKTYNKHLPMNYFSKELIFEESETKKLGNVMEEYLDLNEFKIVKAQISDKSLLFTDPVDIVNQMTLSDLKSRLSSSSCDSPLILDLDFEKFDSEKSETPVFTHKPEFPILKSFEEKRGIYDLINVAIAVVKTYKNKKQKERWTLWLEEIKSFSNLPHFFNYFSQDVEKGKSIYKLIDFEYDIDPQQTQAIQDKSAKDFEKLYTENVKYTYKIIDEVFQNHIDQALRDKCITDGTFNKFLDRLSQLTGEKKRVKIPDGGQIFTQEQIVVQSKTEDSSKKTNEKKGVGYTTGTGSIWNVQEYLDSKDSKNSQILNIISILMHSIKEEDNQMKDLILESSLLPILESAMRSGSLLEMAKETELYNSYLDFIVQLAQNKNLQFVLMKIDPIYVPEQKQSISELLFNVANQSKIFLKCLENKQSGPENDQDKKSRELAQKIVSTDEEVQAKITQMNEANQKIQIENLFKQPLDELYRTMLAPQRFEYMDMKKEANGKNFQHAYDNQVAQNLNPSQSKVIRLAQEIADLSNSLPCDLTNAMFCRVDSSRVDMMKVMIMGAAGTPYAHGAFVYDLFFDNNYPNGPPKCLLTTTGGGTVRFNPNLYNQGKVCLSLLGTWRGSSTEMWDPKLSTILQLLLSIQAIIMSSEVYFNEPGYEHEMNKPEGEKKNRGYQNIVKYCNIKYAMIDSIKNPPKGFEKVIRQSFYLKKKMILEEVKQWCEEAKKADEDSAYVGLVYDHNYQWAPQLSKPGAYLKMMDEIYIELQDTLNGIKDPFNEKVEEAAIKSEEIETTVDAKEIEIQGEDLDKVDMTYEESKEQQVSNIDINSAQVKDRWSRYIGAMGIEAVAKQAQSRVLLCELGALGIEIAKNIVLAGCKELVIYEGQNNYGLSLASGQFFLSEGDEGSKAQTCLHKLQELNHYVKVTLVTDQPSILHYLQSQKESKQDPFKIVVISQDQPRAKILEVSDFCRENSIPFIHTFVAGCCAKILTDFGEGFKVLDQNSEEITDVMIESITEKDKETALIKLIQGFDHQFQDGDSVQLDKIQGMDSISDVIDSSSTSSINGKVFKVTKVINRQLFEVELCLSNYSPYSSQGLVKFVKTPKILDFKPLRSYYQMYDHLDQVSLEKIEEAQAASGFFDENLIWSDFEKIQEIRLIDYLQNLLQNDTYKDKEFETKIENIEGDVFMDQIYKTIKDEKQMAKMRNTLFKIAYMMDPNQAGLPPLAAFIGGVVAQEIVKAMTQKFVPIKQLAIFTFSELIDDIQNLKQMQEQPEGQDSYYDEEAQSFVIDEVSERTEVAMMDNTGLQDRQLSSLILFGKDLYQKIQDCNLFMIGAGAIGCELLKNYAMLGLGTGNGHIILTDPDVIEVSNLNRQFLFREKHLRQPKSTTAAAAAIQMNKNLKGHISARLDKIHDGTADIYSEKFFQNQTIITNALDNVQARLYIDEKCVQARVPMIDSGTLGPKGHVQVVKPHKTESYSSQKDPETSNEIPHCTLKMFPEETLHCVEWAKDYFENTFTLDAQSFNKFLFEDDQKDLEDPQVISVAKKVVKNVDKRPKTFDDCIEKARKKFQSFFVNKILQLIHVYPLDKVTNEGRLFWSLPKRAPQKVDFDCNNQTHQDFVSAFACLLAKKFGISLIEDPRSSTSKLAIAKKASTFKVKDFVPNDQKAQEIENQVNKKEEEKSSLVEEEQHPKVDQEFKKRVAEIIKTSKQELNVEEFEKDVDENFHIDFIYAMANIRAQNYGLPHMDWITVKIKAGKIVPALATTTAAIAGLQTIELLKFLKDLPIENLRNSFLNLAVPSLMMGEPGPPQKFKAAGTEFTLWDRWEIKGDPSITLLQVLEGIGHYHGNKLLYRDVFFGSQPIMLKSLILAQNPGLKNISEWKEISKPLLSFVKKGEIIDLTVTFEEEGSDEIVKNIPKVRVIINNS